jgi:phospholipase C
MAYSAAVRTLCSLALVACSSSPTEPPPSCLDAPDSCRASCGYGSGDRPDATLADAFPAHIPVEHLILVMQENRTFDHYFSSLTVPGQTVDGAPATASNPNPTKPGAAIARFHQTAFCFDNPAESWDEVHREVNGGAMDGFTVEAGLESPVNDPTGSRVMGYYDETDLPFYYALARSFAISDRHFASVLANSWTNRLFYMAGTSYGVTSNVMPDQEDADGTVYPNLFTRLNDAGVTWNFYVQDFPTLAILGETWAKNISHVQPFEQFFTDAAAGQLASVTFVEGTDMMGGVSPDEDPPADYQVGQAMVARIVASTMTSPHWPDAALFLTYDEQGGFYDHVPPPAACVPDDIPPQIDAGGVVAAYDSYGLRVPLMVISPYAKRGYVSHQVTDHTSILRFVSAKFGLPALTHRDANAVPPFDMFDFDHQDLTVPQLPDATIDTAARDMCASKYPGH